MRPFRVWSRRGYAEILSSPSIAFSLEHFYVVVAPSEHKKRKSFFFSFWYPCTMEGFMLFICHQLFGIFTHLLFIEKSALYNEQISVAPSRAALAKPAIH